MSFQEEKEAKPEANREDTDSEIIQQEIDKMLMDDTSKILAVELDKLQKEREQEEMLEAEGDHDEADNDNETNDD